MRTVLLTNIEYNLLYKEGGDDLIAFFATLRASKTDVVFKKKGRRGSYATIRSYTNLSLNTIRKYFPVILKLNLCEVHSNGNISLHSRKKNRQNIKSSFNHKLIPINVSNKLSDTKTSAYFVRVHSNLKKQEKAITKKTERIELYCKYEQGNISLTELKALKRLHKRGVSEKSLRESHRSNSTLANTTFSTLKKTHRNKKSSGNYHKSKLIKKGLISQKRKFELYCRGIKTISDLNYLRSQLMVKGLFLFNNRIFQEVSPEIKYLQ